MIKKCFFILIYSFLCLFANAIEVYVNGLYYTLGPNSTAYVSNDLYGSKKYKGDVVVPEKIECSYYVMTSYITDTCTVVGVSDVAFYGNTELTSVTLPKTVNSIGISAFSDCSNLTTVNLPEGVSRIGEYAFSNCQKIDSIQLSDNVKAINKSTFFNCYSLSYINLGNSVETISSNAFFGCKKLTSIIIPDATREINENAFYDCSNIVDMTLGDNVSYIGDYCFYNCSKIKEIRLTDKITYIGQYAFENCAEISEIYLGNIISYIGPDIFKNCNCLATLRYNIIDYKNSLLNQTTLILGETPFKKVIIGDDVLSIPDFFVYKCKTLSQVSFGRNLKKIGYCSFAYCDNLVSLTLPESTSKLSESSFAGCIRMRNVNIPDNIETIPVAAFYGCTSLSSIIIPESVKLIDKDAFSGCSNLITAVIGRNVSEINHNAFKGCRLAKLIIIPSSITINFFAFTNEGERMTYVSNTGFENVSNIGTISICNINNRFAIDNVWYIPVSAKERTCSIIDFVPSNTALDINIPEKVSYQGIALTPVSINANAFYCCDSLQSIRIASSITIIGNSAFFNCSKLSNLVLPDNLENMGVNAFKDCISLDSITIPDKVSVVPDYSFENNRSLTKVILGANVSTLGKNAFAKCDNMVELKCLSAKPASCDIGSIDDLNKFLCKLLVPVGAKAVYGSANKWSDFFLIEEYQVTGFTQIPIDEDYPIAEYNIKGMKSPGESGLKIIKLKSGKVLKLIIRQ